MTSNTTSSEQNMAHQTALQHKEKGNEAYKEKQFDVAIAEYDKAIELDATNCTLHTNKAAVYFEQGEYDKCIEECMKAVDIGRENRADFKLIGKALHRAGTASLKMGNLANAKIYLAKSLSEFRNPDVKTTLQQVEKKLAEEQRTAYINPQLADEEKEEGNKCFKDGKYPDAVQHYTEAIKRNPGDAKLYSNRAGAYAKLMEFPLALKDCEECIKIDSKFVKAYLRKGAVLMALKEIGKAREAYTCALDLDPDCGEAEEGLEKCMMDNMSNPDAARKNAMRDPEIMKILNDPAMRIILEQAQQNPKALMEHLQNPEVAAKFQKLVESGIVGLK